MEYDDWRRSVFFRDDFTCQMCKERGGKLSAHHIIPFSENRGLALVLSNGIALCWPCHRKIKGKEHIWSLHFMTIVAGREGSEGAPSREQHKLAVDGATIVVWTWEEAMGAVAEADSRMLGEVRDRKGETLS